MCIKHIFSEINANRRLAKILQNTIKNEKHFIIANKKVRSFKLFRRTSNHVKT